MSKDVDEPFLELGPHALPRSFDARSDLLLLLDRRAERARSDEAERVDEDGVRCGERLDQPAADRRTGALRGRHGDLQLRVALHQLVALDEVGQIRLVGDVEEDGEDSDEEAHDV